LQFSQLNPRSSDGIVLLHIHASVVLLADIVDMNRQADIDVLAPWAISVPQAGFLEQLTHELFT
jgi:hypothetical protein